jgi:hypothetical protein
LEEEMSESSDDKTRRKFANQLLQPVWTYQYSFFYESPDLSNNLLEDQKVFRQELRRKFPYQPFLVRIQMLNRGQVLQAYLTLYTTCKTVGMREVADRYFPQAMKMIYRHLTDRSRENKAHKIHTQNPQNLTKLFGSVRVRRYGVINKHLLTDIEE